MCGKVHHPVEIRNPFDWLISFTTGSKISSRSDIELILAPCVKKTMGVRPIPDTPAQTMTVSGF